MRWKQKEIDLLMSCFKTTVNLPTKKERNEATAAALNEKGVICTARAVEGALYSLSGIKPEPKAATGRQL